MRSILIATALVVGLTSAAFAQKAGEAADIVETNAKPAVTEPKTSAYPADTTSCKQVKITRAGVDKPKSAITFKGADVASVKKCNPETARVVDTPNGVMVEVTYTRDGATSVSLPATLAAGSAHYFRCFPDETGSVKDVVLYNSQWTDGLPNAMEIKAMDKALYDADKLLATCKKLSVAGKLMTN